MELVLFRAITGLSCALVMPNVYAFVGDVVQYEKRGRAMGMVTGAMGASTVLGIPLGALLAQLGSWQNMFWVIGGVSLLVLVGTFKLLPIKKIETEVRSVSWLKTYRNQISMVFSNRLIALALLTTFLWWVGWQGLFSVMGTFYSECFHLNTLQIGYLFALAGVGNMTGNQVGGRFADRLGKRPVLITACMLSALCVFLIPHTGFPLSVIFIMHLIWAHATGWGQSALGTLVSELSPSARATVMGLNSSATYLGMTIASALAALVLSSYGFSLVGEISAAAFILVVFLVARVIKEVPLGVTTPR